MVSGFTDWADGKLARWLDQGSRLGALLDPAADRLYIVATLVALALREIVPVWVVALLVGRELVLGVALLVLRHYGYPPLQVHYLGKAATLLLLYAFPALLIADGDGLAGRRSSSPSPGPSPSGGRRSTCWPGCSTSSRWSGIVRAERAGRRDGAVTADPAGWRPALAGRLPARRRARRDARPGLRAGRGAPGRGAAGRPAGRRSARPRCWSR